MLTVILSAGKSTRLTHDGFPRQKCMLPMPNGQTLLEWQLKTAPTTGRILYVSRVEYQRDELSTIIRIKGRYKNFKAVWIKKGTNGPLDGLWYIRKFLNVDEELLILYNDELIEADTMDGFIQACQHYPAGVVCFENDDPRFSRIPGEKALACGCTYYFKSGREFVKAMKGKPRKAENGVPDIVYSFGKFMPFFIGVNEYVELGTAREYKTFMAEQGKPIHDW